jgi:hypothetical protein
MTLYKCSYRLSDGSFQTVEVEANNKTEAVLKGIANLNFPKTCGRVYITPLGCERVE